jgi:ATP-binding cassette subfamily C protein CydC
MRYYPYQQGEIRLGGIDISQCHPEVIRSQLSLVSQDTHLFNTSIRENLLVANPSAEEREMVAAASKAQIHEFIQSLPDGYQTIVGEFGTRLSAGERQRLSLARALLKPAPILVLDEPTSNLDAINRAALMGLVIRQLEGRSLILLTHHLAWLESMDEILVMREGEIIERGSHSKLLAHGGLYARMYAIQQSTLLRAEV